MDKPQRTTRLAPSPTGALHLGNARTFLMNWAVARQRGWGIMLRIEDLDTPRVKQGASEQAMEDLAWLGMDWDDGPTSQRNDLSPYRDALRKLAAMQLIYPCDATRSEIATAGSAPHGDEHEMRYPNINRPTDMNEVDYFALDHSAAGDIAWRVIIPDENISFNDAFARSQSMNVQQHIGDFMVATKAGLPAYQLAVVVDDARQGVTDVFRGDDLLASAARQMWLYRYLFEDETPPNYWHVPLVLGEDGRRLAKRHGDTRLATYREAGVPAEQIIGLIAFWAGMIKNRMPMSATEFARGFDITALPHSAVTFTKDDHAWLMEGTH